MEADEFKITTFLGRNIQSKASDVDAEVQRKQEHERKCEHMTDGGRVKRGCQARLPFHKALGRDQANLPLCSSGDLLC